MTPVRVITKPSVLYKLSRGFLTTHAFTYSASVCVCFVPGTFSKWVHTGESTEQPSSSQEGKTTLLRNN